MKKYLLHTLLMTVISVSMLCSCLIKKNTNDVDNEITIDQASDTNYSETEKVTNAAPPMLSVFYYFEKSLSKDEAEEYIRGIDSIAEVTSTVPLSNAPIDDYSSNFLRKGTKLYFVNDGVVAIDDDGEDYYAALLVVDKDIN